MPDSSLAEAVSAFGLACKAKLSNRAATGQPEDQLRAPLEDGSRRLDKAAGPWARLIGKGS